MKDIEYEKDLLQSKIDYMKEFEEMPPAEFDLIFELGWDAKEISKMLEGSPDELVYSIEEYLGDGTIIPHNLNTDFDDLDWSIVPVGNIKAVDFSLMTLRNNHKVMLKILKTDGSPLLGAVKLKIKIKKKLSY